MVITSIVTYTDGFRLGSQKKWLMQLHRGLVCSNRFGACQLI